MGEIPDWYRLIVAAKYLEVPPWVLAEQNAFWMEAGLAARNAEIEAENHNH